MFGLTPFEVANGSAWATLRDWAHYLHLYRRGCCTCHPRLGKRQVVSCLFSHYLGPLGEIVPDQKTQPLTR